MIQRCCAAAIVLVFLHGPASALTDADRERIAIAALEYAQKSKALDVAAGLAFGPAMQIADERAYVQYQILRAEVAEAYNRLIAARDASPTTCVPEHGI